MICAKLAPLALGAAAASCFPAAQADSGWSQLNMPRGVTEISRKIYDLHMEIFWVCVDIAVVVFGTLNWWLITYRKARREIPDGTMGHNTNVETIWTVVPVYILNTITVAEARAQVDVVCNY